MLDLTKKYSYWGRPDIQVEVTCTNGVIRALFKNSGHKLITIHHDDGRCVGSHWFDLVEYEPDRLRPISECIHSEVPFK